MLDKYPINKQGDMMKIEMKHHPGVTVLQNSEEIFPTEVHGQNLVQFSGNSVTDSHTVCPAGL